jgi:hypothetical protein
MHDLPHGALQTPGMEFGAFPLVVALHGNHLRGLRRAAQHQDLSAEFGDFGHVVGDVKKAALRKDGLYLENDLLAGEFIHIGQTFIHDEQIEFLQKIANEVGAVLLAERKPMKT